MPPRTAAATAARWANTIDVDELRRYIAGGMTTAAIATELGVSVKGVEKAKKRHNVRTYPPLTDEEIIVLIHNLYPAPSMNDGYRQVSARLRCVWQRASPLGGFGGGGGSSSLHPVTKKHSFFFPQPQKNKSGKNTQRTSNQSTRASVVVFIQMKACAAAAEGSSSTSHIFLTHFKQQLFTEYFYNNFSSLRVSFLSSPPLPSRPRVHHGSLQGRGGLFHRRTSRPGGATGVSPHRPQQ